MNMLPQSFRFTSHRQSTLAALHQAKNMELLQSMSRDTEEAQTDGLDTTQSSQLFKPETMNAQKEVQEEVLKDVETASQADAAVRKDL